jgi:hypothetical protein
MVTPSQEVPPFPCNARDESHLDSLPKKIVIKALVVIAALAVSFPIFAAVDAGVLSASRP